MFSKNLKFFRLRAGMNKKQLAEAAGLSAMAITYYENGERRPESIEIINRLADSLQVSPLDFLKSWSSEVSVKHGKYRKLSHVSAKTMEEIEMSCEEYFHRFFSLLEILGGQVLPAPPKTGHLHVQVNDPEKMALQLRRCLGFAEEGPILNLISQLENKGILVFQREMDDRISGLNGYAGDYPYILNNSGMSAQRSRSNMAHELVHLMFNWEGVDEKIEESLATAVGCAFLIPRKDITRELGYHREKLGIDFEITAREYGVSLQLLIKRAELCGVLTKTACESFYKRISHQRLRKHEFYFMEMEESSLMLQLTSRAFSESLINMRKAAELLNLTLEQTEALLVREYAQ